MKIGLFTPAWPGTRTANGITTAVGYLAEGLSDIGHEVTIVTMQTDAPHNTPRVYEVARQPWSLWDKLGAKLWNKDMDQRILGRAIAQTTAQAVARENLDVVIMEETQGWAWHVQRAVSVPVVVTLHGPWVMHKTIRALQKDRFGPADQRRAAREAHALQHCAAITAPSQNVLEMVRQAVALPDIEQHIIPNPMPPASKDAIPAHVAGPAGSFLFVGRFDSLKGGDTVLEGFAKLIETHPYARLTFAGPDRGLPQPDGSKLMIADMLKTLPEAAQAAITYLGPLPAEEVAVLQSRHAITLIASHYEVLGYTLLEAMTAGAAIICTAVGGPKDILRHEETALLINPGDADALAACARRLLDDPALAARLGMAGRQFAESRFAPEAIARQTEALLTQISLPVPA